MKTTYKGVKRVRCDVCGILIPVKKEGRKVRDAVRNSVKDVCSPSCAERYFHDEYQLQSPLHSVHDPYGNTGVLFPKSDKT